MGKVVITIETDNAAFEFGEKMELNSILADIIGYNAHSLDELDGFKLRDSNGNTVGKVEVE